MTQPYDSQLLERAHGFRPRYSTEWLYTASYFLLLIVTLALASPIPIDIIVQSKTNNSHLATNTIIILIIISFLIIFSVALHALRLFYNKLLLQDVPKSYIPITKQDIGGKMSRIINDETIRSQQLKELAKPIGQIVHPGMYHRSKLENGLEEYFDYSTLPDNLIYENILRVIGQELKYNNTLTLSDNRVLKLSNRFTLREELTRAFKSRVSRADPQRLESFFNLYEQLRYSGEPITLDEFKQFLQDWNYVKSAL